MPLGHLIKNTEVHQSLSSAAGSVLGREPHPLRNSSRPMIPIYARSGDDAKTQRACNQVSRFQPQGDAAAAEDGIDVRRRFPGCDSCQGAEMGSRPGFAVEGPEW